MRRWHGLLLSAVFLLMACGSAISQQVNIVARTNANFAASTTSSTITTFESGLDTNANVLVVGFYGDNSSSYSPAPTFGGVAPSGFMDVSAVGQSREGVAWWINPNDTNTYPNHDIVLNYNSAGNGGYFWAFELSGVNTNVPVLKSGATTSFANTVNLTTTNYNTLIISFYSVNTPTTVNALTPNSPLFQVGSTYGNTGGGYAFSSATNNIFAPGLQTISWNSTISTANQGLAALGFVAGQPGAPGVLASATPSGGAAPGQAFTVTATTYPGVGTVTNVSVNLTPIGGSAANNLVQSSNPSVWTNTFIVPGGAPYPLTTNFVVTATQNTQPLQGSGPLQFTVVTPAPPAVFQDTFPSNFLTLYVGEGVAYSASFTGPQPIYYNWQYSPPSDGSTFTNIPGATNITYTIPTVGLGNAGYYQLMASNAFGTTVSSYSYLIVNSGPPFPTYLWGAPISFATLNADQILTNFSGTYIAGALVAKNGGSPITVTNSSADSPIVFAVPGTWASLSGGAGYFAGVNTNQTGNANFNTCLNDAYINNTPLITMSGLVVGQKYQVQLFGLDDRAGLNPASSARFVTWSDPNNANDTSESFAMSANVYMLGTFTATNTVMAIQENTLNTSSGNFNCLVLRAVGWTPPPFFVSQPANTNVFVGNTVFLSATAAGDSTIASPTITYQWAAGPTNGPYSNLSNGNKYTGVTTPTLTISNAVGSDSGVVYVLKASNSGGTTTSVEAHVYVQSPLVLPPANSFGGAVLALTTNRLVGFWQLNETNDPSSGLLVAIDASTNKHSGTYGTAVQNAFNGVLAPQPPTFGGFATNQGALKPTSGDANSVVNLPALFATNGVNTTICMWINPSVVQAANTGLLYNRSAVDQCGIQFGGTTGGPSGQYNLTAFWANANGEATYTLNTGLYPVNNTWNFVVLVVRTNALTYYLDYVDANGVAYLGKATDTASRYTQQQWGGTPIWLGGDPNGTEFAGSIANVAMFNSALTDDQVSALFTAGFQTAGFPAGFTQQPPAAQTNYTGYTVQIIAQTGGSSPITNQWKFNGTNLADGWYNGSIISGSTSNVLTILNASSNWNGVFNLAITNSINGAVSSNSTLTILTPSAPPAGNLVGEWFDGTASLADHSGHLPGTHNAYGVGATATNYRFTNNVPPGKSGSSLNLFGGTSMGISNSSTNDVGYVNTFDEGITNSFSVMAWAQGQPAAWNPFVSKNGEVAGWQLRRSAGANAVFTMRGTGSTDDPAGAAGGSGADGAWHHYVGTYDSVSGIRTLYVDGVVQNVTTGAGLYTLFSGARLVLGGKSTNSLAAIDGTANFTGGMLYDVRIYNTAISAAQVAYLAAPPPLPTQKISANVTPPSGGNPGQMVLTWLNGGWLLQSTNVAGPWVTNQAATPPYTVLMTNKPAGFFKVLFP